MENKKYLLNNRYGHRHCLVQVDGDKYELVIDEDAPNIRICYKGEDEASLEFVDPEGGPFIMEGWPLNQYTPDYDGNAVVSHIEVGPDKKIMITIQERHGK